jgi:hypothetical protein
MPRRNPTLKAEMEDLGRKSVPVAFFTYPVMQVANIRLPRARLVLVGQGSFPTSSSPESGAPLQAAVQGRVPRVSAVIQ